MADLNLTAVVDVVTDSLSSGRRKIEAELGKPISINIQPLGRITGSVDEFSKSMNAANARVLAFGASAGIISVVAEGMRNMVREAINVEKSLIDINSILRTSSSGLQQFGNSLFQIAANTGTSFEEVAEAAKSLARQGLSATETLKRTNDALILTRLSGLSAAESVEVLTATINTFSKEALSTTEIINRLANTDAHFAVTAGDLAEALQRTGTVAQAAKVSFNELVAVVTAAEQQTGRSGTFISNALNSIFTRLDRTDTLDKLSQLGIAVRDVSGATLPAINILTQLSQRFNTLTEAQRVNISQSIAGVRQTTILNSLLTDLGGKYSITRSALSNLNDTTDQAIVRNEALNRSISAMANESLANFTKMSAAAGKLVFGPSLERIFGSFNSASNSIDGKGIGSKVGEGILKGIGNAISGPGLVIGGFLAAKLFGSFVKFAHDSTQKVLGIAQASEKQKAVQEQINGVISRNLETYENLVKSGKTIQEIEQQTLEIITKEVRQKEILSDLTTSLGARVVQKGYRADEGGFIAPKSTKTASAGYLPNLLDNGSIYREIEGAQRQGYMVSPSQVRSMRANINGRPSDVVYNTREQVIQNYAGTGEPAIIPPTKSVGSLMQERHAAGGFNPMRADSITQKKYLASEAARMGISVNELNESNPGLLKALMEEHRLKFPRTASEKLNSYVDRGNWASGFVPSLAAGVEFQNNRFQDSYPFWKYQSKYIGKSPRIDIPDTGLITSNTGGYGPNLSIPVSWNHFWKELESSARDVYSLLQHKSTQDEFFHKGVPAVIRPGWVGGFAPTDQETFNEIGDGGKYFEKLITNTYGTRPPTSGQSAALGVKGDFFGEDFQKIVSQLPPEAAASIPSSVTNFEAKNRLWEKEIFKNGKRTHGRRTGAGPASLLANEIRRNPQILRQLIGEPIDELIDFQSNIQNKDFKTLLGFSGGFVPNLANPYSLRKAGISRQEQKIIGKMLTGMGGEGLASSAELLRTGTPEQKARIIKNYSNHSAFDGLGLSEAEKGQILDKALKTVHILKNGMHHPNMGYVGSKLNASGGHSPFQQMSAHEAMSAGLTHTIPGLGEAIARETTGTGVSINQARVNFLSGGSGLPPVAVTNTRDEGYNADPFKGFGRVSSRGGRPELAGSGREWAAKGYVPNLVEDPFGAGTPKNPSPSYFGKTDPTSPLNEGSEQATRKALEEKRKEELKVVEEEVEVEKKNLSSTKNQLTDNLENERKTRERAGKFQQLGFFAAFGIPALGGVASEFVKNPRSGRDVSGITNAIGTGTSIASVLPNQAGAIIGVLVGGLGALKVAVSNLVPSFEDLQKKTDDLVAKQSLQNQSVQSVQQSEAKLAISKDSGDPTLIRSATSELNRSLSGVIDPRLKRGLINSFNSPNKRAEILEKLRNEQDEKTAQTQVGSSFEAVGEKRENFLGIPRAALLRAARITGIGRENIRGIFESKNASNEDINGIVAQSREAGVGSNLNKQQRGDISKELKAIDATAPDASDKLNKIGIQLGYTAKQAQFFDNLNPRQLTEAFQRLNKALGDDSAKKMADQMVAVIDNSKKFTIQLSATAAAFNSVNAIRQARSEGEAGNAASNLDYINQQRSSFGNASSDAQDSYVAGIQKARNDAALELRDISNTGRNLLTSDSFTKNRDLYKGDTKFTESFRSSLVAGATGQTDPLETVSDLKELLTKKVTGIAGGEAALDGGGDSGENGAGVQALVEMIKQLSDLNTRAEVSKTKQDIANEHLAQIYELTKQTNLRNRAEGSLGGLGILNGNGLDNTASLSGIGASFQKTLTDNNPYIQQRRRLAQRAFGGGGALGRSEYAANFLNEQATQARTIGNGTVSDFQNGFLPTGEDLEIAKGFIPGGENSVAYKALEAAHNNARNSLEGSILTDKKQAIQSEAQGTISLLFSNLNNSKAYQYSGRDNTRIFRTIQTATNNGDFGSVQKHLSQLSQGAPNAGTRDIINSTIGRISDLQVQQQYAPIGSKVSAYKDAGDSSLVNNTKAVEDNTKAITALTTQANGQSVDGKNGPLEVFNSSIAGVTKGTDVIQKTLTDLDASFKSLQTVLGPLIKVPTTKIQKGDSGDVAIPSKAAGYIPSMIREQQDINNGVGGARRTDHPMLRNVQGLGLSVINSGEKVIDNFIPGKAAILNRQQQMSGNFAGGYIPSFANGSSSWLEKHKGRLVERGEFEGRSATGQFTLASQGNTVRGDKGRFVKRGPTTSQALTPEEERYQRFRASQEHIKKMSSVEVDEQKELFQKILDSGADISSKEVKDFAAAFEQNPDWGKIIAENIIKKHIISQTSNSTVKNGISQAFPTPLNAYKNAKNYLEEAFANKSSFSEDAFSTFRSLGRGAFSSETYKNAASTAWRIGTTDVSELGLGKLAVEGGVGLLKGAVGTAAIEGNEYLQGKISNSNLSNNQKLGVGLASDVATSATAMSLLGTTGATLVSEAGGLRRGVDIYQNSLKSGNDELTSRMYLGGAGIVDAINTLSFGAVRAYGRYRGVDLSSTGLQNSFQTLSDESDRSTQMEIQHQTFRRDPTLDPTYNSPFRIAARQRTVRALNRNRENLTRLPTDSSYRENLTRLPTDSSFSMVPQILRKNISHVDSSGKSWYGTDFPLKTAHDNYDHFWEHLQIENSPLDNNPNGQIEAGDFAGSRAAYAKYISNSGANSHTDTSFTANIGNAIGVDGKNGTLIYDNSTKSSEDFVAEERAARHAAYIPGYTPPSGYSPSLSFHETQFRAQLKAQRNAPASQILPNHKVYDFNGDAGYYNNYAGGYNPVTDAINREVMALRKRGINDPSAVYVGHDSRIGIGVGNRYDEPYGLSSGVSRVIAQGQNPHTSGMPNFAENTETSGNFSAVLSALTQVTSMLGSVANSLTNKGSEQHSQSAPAAHGSITVDANVRVSGNDASGVGQQIANEIKSRLNIVESQIKQIAKGTKTVLLPGKANNR